MGSLLDEVRDRRYLARLPGRAIREAAGVSQQRLASELGVHRISVARWEAGDRQPRGELRRRYVKLLRDLQEAG